MSKVTLEDIDHPRYRSMIRIFLLPPGHQLTIDFKQFHVQEPTLFFVNVNQYFQLSAIGDQVGTMIYYNRDFYCVQIHDQEVACDGLLFNNIFEVPAITLTPDMYQRISQLINAMASEFEQQLSSREEMIRTYLKQLIIHATRMLKQQHTAKQEQPVLPDMEFYRQFSTLVEIHYREKHGLADYADLLHMTAKNVSKRLSKLHIRNPNELIKERILLEAKRLLSYTSMSVKEIAYELGYDDPAYFNRLFTLKNQCTPAAFRKQFMQEEI
jgi:AraC-like DNA-binding protein